MADPRITDASVLAYELRDFHNIMGSYKGGFTMEADAMPAFVATLDDFATRAERILRAEDERLERTDLQTGVERVRGILAAARTHSQLFNAAVEAHDAALREAVQSGKVAMLRPSPTDLAEGIGSAT